MKPTALLFFALMQASAMADSTATTYSASEPKAQGAALTALNFFEPVRANVTRTRSWPDHLTLEPVAAMSIKEALQKLDANRWRMALHCEGRPINNNKNRGYLVGTMGGLEFDFSSADRMQTVTIKSESGKWSSTEQKTFFISESFGGAQFKGAMEPFTIGKFRFLRIKETGEYAVEGANSVHEGDSNAVCGPGSQLKLLMIPLGEPLTS